MPDVEQGPRFKTQRAGKPHCARSADGTWIAVSPGGHVRWAATPREAAVSAMFHEWLSKHLVRTPIDPYDYARMQEGFAREWVGGVMPEWADVLTVRH